MRSRRGKGAQGNVATSQPHRKMMRDRTINPQLRGWEMLAFALHLLNLTSILLAD